MGPLGSPLLLGTAWVVVVMTALWAYGRATRNYSFVDLGWAANFFALAFVFGVFAGTAIHSTPQVVGAGFIYSEVAGHTATAVKLVRNCFIAPVVLAVALSEAPRRAAANGSSPGAETSDPAGSSAAPSLRKAFPWFLFGFFVLAGLNSAELIDGAIAGLMGRIGKLLMLVGMAGVGLNTPSPTAIARRSTCGGGNARQ